MQLYIIACEFIIVICLWTGRQ